MLPPTGLGAPRRGHERGDGPTGAPLLGREAAREAAREAGRGAGREAAREAGREAGREGARLPRIYVYDVPALDSSLTLTLTLTLTLIPNPNPNPNLGPVQRQQEDDRARRVAEELEPARLDRAAPRREEEGQHPTR